MQLKKIFKEQEKKKSPLSILAKYKIISLLGEMFGKGKAMGSRVMTDGEQALALQL